MLPNKIADFERLGHYSSLVVKIKRKSPDDPQQFQGVLRLAEGSKRLILSTRSLLTKPSGNLIVPPEWWLLHHHISRSVQVPDQPICNDVRSEPVGVVIPPLPLEPKSERQGVRKVLRVSDGEFGVWLGHERENSSRLRTKQERRGAFRPVHSTLTSPLGVRGLSLPFFPIAHEAKAREAEQHHRPDGGFRHGDDRRGQKNTAVSHYLPTVVNAVGVALGGAWQASKVDNAAVAPLKGGIAAADFTGTTAIRYHTMYMSITSQQVSTVESMPLGQPKRHPS
jgi:hypothetical protein